MSITTDTTTPLTDAATVADITAAAEHRRRAAAAAAERGDRDRAEAETLMARAREEAARIIGEAEASARPLTNAADVAEREAAALAGRAQRLDRAAGFAAQAEASAARVSALEAERDDLAAKQADLGRRLAELAAERRGKETDLAAARDNGDLDLITTLRTRLDAIADLEGTLQARQARLAVRLGAIGDGEVGPVWPQKELAEAPRVAGIDQRRVRASLNEAQPERQEAVADAASQHQQLLDHLAAERGAAERARQAPPRRQTFLR